MINRFSPVIPSTAVGKWIDNLFNLPLADAIGSDFMVSSPSVNIVEHDHQFNMHLAAPGLEKNDFAIRVENDYLIVSAEKKSEKEETDKRYTRREFNYSSFKRSFQLDETIDREKITAAYENGVLNITLPKKEESWKKPAATTIEIK